MKKNILLLFTLYPTFLLCTSTPPPSKNEKENLLENNIEQRIAENKSQCELLIKTAAEQAHITEKEKARSEFYAALKNFAILKGSWKEVVCAYKKRVLANRLPKEISLAIIESYITAHPELLENKEISIPCGMYEEFLKLGSC